MAVKMYGTTLCSDTLAAINLFEERNVSVDFRNISEDLTFLKEFLSLRDNSPVFEEIRKNGGIGIPCFVFADGHISLDPRDVIK
jgi:glutaredoxin-related protein